MTPETLKAPEAGTVTDVAALFAALPEEQRSAMMERLQSQLKANELETERRTIVSAVSTLFEKIAQELVAVLPPGKELHVRHLAADKDKDGKDIPARLVFDVEVKGGGASTGSAATEDRKAPRKGKRAKMSLDGKDIVADSWRACLDATNEALKAAGKKEIPVPTSSFNARTVLMGAAGKIAGLSYVGDIE